MGTATPKFRVLVQREEESKGKAEDAVFLGDILPPFAEAGPPNEGKTSGSSPSTGDEEEPEPIQHLAEHNLMVHKWYQ